MYVFLLHMWENFLRIYTQKWSYWVGGVVHYHPYFTVIAKLSSDMVIIIYISFSSVCEFLFPYIFPLYLQSHILIFATPYEMLFHLFKFVFPFSSSVLKLSIFLWIAYSYLFPYSVGLSFSCFVVHYRHSFFKSDCSCQGHMWPPHC